MALPVHSELLFRPRAHQHGQADQGAEDQQTNGEQYKDDQKSPEQLPGARLFLAMTAVAAALNLVDGAVKPRSFAIDFGEEKKENGGPENGRPTHSRVVCPQNVNCG